MSDHRRDARHRVLTAVLARRWPWSGRAWSPWRSSASARCSAAPCSPRTSSPHGQEATAARAAATAAVGRRLADRVVGRARGARRRHGRRVHLRPEQLEAQGHLLARVLGRGQPGRSGHHRPGGRRRRDSPPWMPRCATSGARPRRPRGGLDRVRDEYWTAGQPAGRSGTAPPGSPAPIYTCADGVTVLVQPTSDREPSADARRRLRLRRSSTTTISRSWYTAGRRHGAARSPGRAAGPRRARSSSRTTAPASDAVGRVTLPTRWRASRRADGEQALTG